MTTTADSSTGPRVPAWKKLGLKLKQPGAACEPADGTPASVGHPNGTQHRGVASKRKFDAPPAAWDSSPSVKKIRGNSQAGSDKNGNFAQPGASKKTKSVTFGDTPTRYGTAPPPVSRRDTPAKPANTRSPVADTKSPLGTTPNKKKSKGPGKKQTPPSTDITPAALEYLRRWKTSRDSWKFNKNLQSELIKAAFDPEKGIPSSDIGAFYEYIRDLKGFVRIRLAETAMEIRAADARGATVFPSGTSDVETKQAAYETLLVDLLRASQLGQKRKIVFHEAEYMASPPDAAGAVITRLVKRMRAEMVVEELSDGEETEASTSTKSSNTITTSDNQATVTTDPTKKLQLNKNAASGKRRRKLRISNMDDSSSSSSSDSDSDGDSDTSSSGSSSDDSSDDEDGDSDDELDAQSADGYDTSSSSSSSSSSGDESDSDDDDDDGDIGAVRST